MEFKIVSVEYKVEELLEHYPCLDNYGFVIRQAKVPRKIRIWDDEGKPLTQIHPMLINYAVVQINSLSELLDLRSALDEDLIIKEDTIEIYDGYRE